MSLTVWAERATKPSTKETRTMSTPITQSTVAATPTLEHLRAHLNSIISDQHKELELLHSISHQLRTSLYGSSAEKESDKAPVSQDHSLQEGIEVIGKLMAERQQVMAYLVHTLNGGGK